MAQPNGKPQSRPMQSRVGRDNQRYDPGGERLVAGVVPVSTDGDHVMLIQSNHRKGWVLPKGGWEKDETCEEAAKREAWEEGGISVRLGTAFHVIEEQRPVKTSKGRAKYQFYYAIVVDQFEVWPEDYKRDRRWFTWDEASEALESRPELLEALKVAQKIRH